jgi:hypothetical protein
MLAASGSERLRMAESGGHTAERDWGCGRRLKQAAGSRKLLFMADHESSGELGPQIERFLAAAREHAQRIYSTQLDFSARSIADVELILGRLSESIPHGRFQKLIRKQPSPEQIAHLALIYGIYLGEVLRRKFGGEWRLESAEGEKTIGLRLPAGTTVYPASQTYRRLLGGAAENVEKFFARFSGES